MSGMTESRPRTVPFERGSALVVGVVVAAALALAVLWWWDGRAQQTTTASEPVVRPAVTSATATPTGSADPATPVAVTVDIRGAVRSPGPRQLPAGSRVMDAVAAAGGLRQGRRYGSLNLARILTDGEQILVGRSKSPTVAPTAAPGTTPAVPSPGSSTALINLNTADAVTLEQLDGVGPVLAAGIVEWRATNGPFRSVDDLLDVSGIGEATLAGMRDQVTVG